MINKSMRFMTASRPVKVKDPVSDFATFAMKVVEIRDKSDGSSAQERRAHEKAAQLLKKSDWQAGYKAHIAKVEKALLRRLEDGSTEKDALWQDVETLTRFEAAMCGVSNYVEDVEGHCPFALDVIVQFAFAVWGVHAPDLCVSFWQEGVDWEARWAFQSAP